MKRAQQIARLFGGARRSKKRLSDWMRENHDELQAELGKGRIDWDPMVQVIETLGLLDNQGKRPSRDTIFRTWKRVRSVVATERAANAGSPPAAEAANEIAPGVRVLVENGTFRDSSHADRITLVLQPVRALHNSTASLSEPHSILPARSPLVGSPCSADDANAQIDRVFDQIGANRTPMPTKIR